MHLEERTLLINETAFNFEIKHTMKMLAMQNEALGIIKDSRLFLPLAGASNRSPHSIIPLIFEQHPE
jgi:hypothetical protein